MDPRTIESYGGAPQNEEAVVDPVSEWDAPFAARLFEDVAQATKAIGMTWFSFVTTTDAAIVTVDAANVSVSGVWGNGSAAKPVVQKNSTGSYTLTWATEFDDALVGVTNMDTVAETQQVAFTFASGLNVMGGVDGRARVTSIASNIVNIEVVNISDVPSDLAGTATISGYLR